VRGYDVIVALLDAVADGGGAVVELVVPLEVAVGPVVLVAGDGEGDQNADHARNGANEAVEAGTDGVGPQQEGQDADGGQEQQKVGDQEDDVGQGDVALDDPPHSQYRSA